MSSTIKVRRDTAAGWTTANPILADGELGLEKDTQKVKYGNGTTAWTSLPYFGSSGTTIPVQGTAPTSPAEGDLWVDTASDPVMTGISWRSISVDPANFRMEYFPLPVLLAGGSSSLWYPMMGWVDGLALRIRGRGPDGANEAVAYSNASISVRHVTDSDGVFLPGEPTFTASTTAGTTDGLGRPPVAAEGPVAGYSVDGSSRVIGLPAYGTYEVRASVTFTG